MQLEHLQQKSEQLGQYEQTRARSELSEAYKELSKLKDELKFSQNDSTRTKGELIEVSREVLRLKEELKFVYENRLESDVTTKVVVRYTSHGDYRSNPQMSY